MSECKTIMETTRLKLNFTNKQTINWKEQVSRICAFSEVTQGHVCMSVFKMLSEYECRIRNGFQYSPGDGIQDHFLCLFIFLDLRPSLFLSSILGKRAWFPALAIFHREPGAQERARTPSGQSTGLIIRVALLSASGSTFLLQRTRERTSR